ncbi:MAG TPA: lipoyl synthase [Actinomycetota bacterium]|nr:lipoyl synthase [Actinomycetota bacterium]
MRRPLDVSSAGAPATDAPRGGMGCASGAGRMSGTRARLREGRALGPQPKPEWLKVKVRTGPNYLDLKRLMREHGLHTVCEESGPCPNIYECWEQRTATFLILGNVCTRRCTFCDIITGRPPELDEQEPERVAKAVAAVGLKYAVVTGVARDDIRLDGGASIWAETIRAIRRHNPACGVEVLTPDFRAMPHAVRAVVEAEPDVFAHNLETVRRLHRTVRKGFDYDRSLEVLRLAKIFRPQQVTKAGMILGMGETIGEVRDSLVELRDAQVDLVTMGQYLSPSRAHPQVDRYVDPDEFAELGEFARGLGFAHVESGPLVRSSYHAREQEQAGRACGA